VEQTDYLDFDLLIEAGDDGYTARVVQSPAGEARREFTRPFTDLELENFVLNVGQTRRGVRRVGSPQWEAALRFGTRLYDTVFAGDVGTAFQVSLNKAQDAGKGLRVRLRLSAVPELASVPWEYLYSGTLGSFLTLLTDTPLVRFIDLPQSVEALTVAPPLTVLVVVSDPTDIAVLDVAQEKERLRQALAKPIEEGRIQLRFLEDARLSSLRDALGENDVHVLHFIGHGGFDGTEGVVAFENDAGTSRMVTSATLAMLLQNFNALRLVVLNACEGARNSAQDPFAGVAQALVRGRIPAVIAMQFEITDRAAIAFCHEFYKAIAKGQPVDAACARGRLALLGEGNDVEWGTPVLYLRAPNGRVFDVDAEAIPDVVVPVEPDAPPEQPPEVTPAPPDSPAADEEQGIPVPQVGSPAGPQEEIPSGDVQRLLGEAHASLDSGDKEAARTAVAQVLQIDPENDEARRISRQLRGRWPILAGGIAAALLALVAFLALRPDPGPGLTDTTARPETTISSQTSTSSETVPPDPSAAGIVRASEPLTIDSDDAEWAALRGGVIASVFHCGDDVWSGLDDYDANWRLAWDDQKLYLLATVTDDVEARNPVSTSTIREGDTITVSLGTEPASRDQPLVEDGFGTCKERGDSFTNPGAGEPGVPLESDFHLALIPGDNEVATWFAQGDGQGAFTGSIDASAIITETVELEDGGFQLEAAIPWAAIGLDGAPAELGVRLEGRDKDLESARPDTYVSTAPGSVTNDTRTWATMPLLGD
jgi:CHAT domain/Carbohydrate family 9 binding domain-like